MSKPVVRTPGVCGGSPCIETTRLTCANVVMQLTFGGQSLDDYLAHHHYLTKQDVECCVEYCAKQMCLVNDQVSYCQGCSLDRSPPPDPPVAYIESLEQLRTDPDVARSGQVFLGTREQYEENLIPEDVWKLADTLLRHWREGGGPTASRT